MNSRERNRYLAWWEFAQARTRVDSTPLEAGIARTNQCNFHCVYCAPHRDGNHAPRERLSDAAWRSLGTVIDRLEGVAFHGVSEFFVDPDFFDIVARCAQRGTALFLNTNGSVCTPRHLEVLRTHPAFVSLDVSIDAINPATYRRIRGFDFWKVLENTQRFAQVLTGRAFPSQMAVSMVLMDSNLEQAPAFVALARSLGAHRAIFRPLNEAHDLDWRIAAPDGSAFDYRAEQCSRHAERFVACIEATRRMADLLGMPIELPGTGAVKPAEAP